MKQAPRTLTLWLACRSLPQLAADPLPVTVGIQDKFQQVHEGVHGEAGWRFACTVLVKPDPASALPAFSGPFVHGTPAKRFLYLSWKRLGDAPTPWQQRVKIPRSALPWHLIEAGLPLEADITGRKPHASEPIVWKLATGARA